MEESLLDLATARWLTEYWSQPPTFSATELRGMLTQAACRLSEEAPVERGWGKRGVLPPAAELKGWRMVARMGEVSKGLGWGQGGRRGLRG